MIASVRGPVTALFVDSAVVEVGGVGMLIHCTPGVLAALRVGEEATLATALVVREDSLTLYGFADVGERVLFELLQTASGVGPKLAQAMLAVHGADTVRRAVATEDLPTLCAVPGIGRKGAARIVLELKDRIAAAAESEPVSPTGSSAAGSDGWRDQVRAGLLGLGWSAREAERAVEAVEPMAAEVLSDGAGIPVADLLRAALRSLSRA